MKKSEEGIRRKLFVRLIYLVNGMVIMEGGRDYEKKG